MPTINLTGLSLAGPLFQPLATRLHVQDEQLHLQVARCDSDNHGLFFCLPPTIIYELMAWGFSDIRAARGFLPLRL